MFTKLLIANRGEIACRVIRTARRLGIATVAVHSEADRDALHVSLADEAVPIGPASSRESYLVAQKIIDACKATGAQAVHPGYGFLSENEDFARRVEEAGIVFVGPKHGAIAAMGDKIASKKLAIAAGVNTIPGWNEAIATGARAAEIARGIGYPVMIKASAGGGGKGLRVAGNDKEAAEGFESCRNEARASFGDDRVFIEKFIESPRHVEIQVLGDAHGHCVFLHERECSLQRRHQKVVEEAPSPFISEATRAAMGAQAVALAKAVGYQSAGTVEFVVGRDQGFYFLEMNTRLQVEHPVTECITGLDLVEWMLRVAAGERLPFTQADIPRHGHAIECRINAEDPSRGFLPSTGRLVRFEPPAATLHAGGPTPPEAFGVRVDTGVEEGGEIPMHYDSMIAKLIVKGRDRADAIRRMQDALDAFVIRGIASNVGFQSALLGHPKFGEGDFSTGFIAEHYPQGFQPEAVPHADEGLLVALAAAADRRFRERAAGIGGQMRREGDGRARLLPTEVVVVLKGEAGAHRPVPVRVAVAADGGLAIEVGPAGDGAAPRRYAVHKDWRLGAIRASGHVNGEPFTAQIERTGAWLRLVHRGRRIEALVLRAQDAPLFRRMPYKAPPDLSRFLLSPMPGLLVDVAVQAGQAVRAGERLAVIEAMKMENVLVAAQDGTVAELLATRGESLAVDQPILSFR
jgi:propionyl-CoA carboxylase alpha chain